MSHVMIPGSLVLLLTALIVFRYGVGGDWSSYLVYLERSRWLTRGEVFLQGDPGFILPFSIGLVGFARVSPIHGWRCWLVERTLF